MSDELAKNKRLAKNTIVLYGRMLIILIVNLYLSRIILNILGVEDYGIYNVVGGFVTMFSLLSESLSNAISRFITVEIGRGELNRQAIIFSTSVIVMIIISIIIFILLESVGVWFLNNKMQIPVDRVVAANWVLQCSIITFIINLISIPYKGCIIAHEKMTAFAYFSIFEVMLKLVSTLFLYIISFDRLIIYAILIAFSALIVRILYGVYCSRKFEECYLIKSFDKKNVSQILSLASWNFLGSGGAILNNQGVNVLINLFFGVTLNTARGIATQVCFALQSFAGSFITAINPQLTKIYVQGDYNAMRLLLHRGIKFSYYLIFIGALPIFIEAPIILKLWLNIVPDYTVSFIRLTILSVLTMVPGNLLYTVAMANGNIKNYQIVVGCLSLSIFFITWLFFLLGSDVIFAYIITFVIDLIILFARIILVNKLININIRKLLTDVFIKIILTSIVAAILPVILHFCLEKTMLNAFIIIISCLLTVLLSIWLVGLNKSERLFVINIVKFKIRL